MTLFLLLCAVCRAQQLVSPAVPVQPVVLPPLVQLGTMLQTSMQLAPSPLVSLDMRKAQILVERAAVGAEVSGRAPDVRSGKELLVAVNSVLKDVSPEQLKSMPVEKLHSLAGVILDQGRSPDAEVVSVLSNARMGSLEVKRGQLSETPMYPYPEERMPDIRLVRGMPESVRRVDSESIVLRHYTKAESLKAILDSKSLRNGGTPYMLEAPKRVWRSFQDLTGVFFTLPGVPAADVGVGKSPVYVDVKLPKGLPLLEIEPGRIYLVPLPARAKQDLWSRFMRWIRGEKIPAYEIKELQDLDADGGPGPTISVPVEIVGRSQ